MCLELPNSANQAQKWAKHCRPIFASQIWKYKYKFKQKYTSKLVRVPNLYFGIQLGNLTRSRIFHPSIDILVGRPTRITEVHPMLAAIFWRMISDYPWFPNCDLALTLFMHPCWNIVFFLFSFTRCRWSVIYIWISILIICISQSR